MPVRKVKGGYRWGKSGKIYKTKKEAEKQGRAIYASGYGKKRKRDPRKGTGKKPKGSGRRLYTDENPKDTVRIKFATMKDARATVRKVKRVRKSYARKIQILTVGEQRARVMGKKTVASIFRAGKASLRRANNAKKNKTKKTRPKTRKSRR